PSAYFAQLATGEKDNPHRLQRHDTVYYDPSAEDIVMDGGVALVPPGESDSSTPAATHIPVISSDNMNTNPHKLQRQDTVYYDLSAEDMVMDGGVALVPPGK
ncbi:hypothetical protein DXG01_015205, partial [Tephrocybe rancida]